MNDKGYAVSSTRAGNVLYKPRPVPQNYGYQRMAARSLTFRALVPFSFNHLP
jgi:hypothetical protein